MINELEPVVGSWYRHADKEQTFRVVAVDGDHDLIEIQHDGGDLEELDSAAWLEMELELAEEPEDWAGSAADVETDDSDYTETDPSESDPRGSLAKNRRPREETALDEDDEAEEDGWDDRGLDEDLDDPES